MDVEIGPLTTDDLGPAAEAIAAGEVFQQYGLTSDRARDLLTSASGPVAVARIGDATVGVAVYWTNGPTPVPAYLRILAVGEAHRGKGVGLALLRHVEGVAFRTGPNLFLCCVTTNQGARRFYERHGYHPVGVLTELIAPGIDEILYRKTLGPIRGYQP